MLSWKHIQLHQKATNGTCPSGTEFELDPPWSSPAACCRAEPRLRRHLRPAAGARDYPAARAPQSFGALCLSSQQPCLLDLLRADRAFGTLSQRLPDLLVYCVPGGNDARVCQSDTDCPVRNACVEGACVEQLLRPNAEPATGGCSPEAMAAGACGPQPPATGGCPAGLFPSNDGRTCCTQQEITRETCGMTPPALSAPKKKRRVPKKRPTKQPDPVLNSQPQTSPGFSIQIGPSFGGGSRGGGGNQGSPGREPRRAWRPLPTSANPGDRAAIAVRGRVRDCRNRQHAEGTRARRVVAGVF